MPIRHLVEDLQVSIYGQPAVALKALRSRSTRSAHITIQPWDKNILSEIEKAISESDIGISPANDGDMIRLRLPEMSSTRRDELVKILGKKAEEAKVAMRNVRKDFHNLIRDAKKDKVISENFFNRFNDVLQKVTDTFVEKAEGMRVKKEKEILSV